MLKQTLIAGAALAAALALSAPVQAAVYASGSTTASSPGGASPVIDFTAPGGIFVDVTVTDCCIGGDYYSTFVDGVHIGTTPFEPQFGSVDSTATFLAHLSAGASHTFQVFDQTDFFLPAGLSYEIQDHIGGVPEPASWALMLVGFFGLGGALRASRAAKFKAAGAVA